MPGADTIFHVIAADTPRARLDVLGVLLHERATVGAQRVVAIGPVGTKDVPIDARVPIPFGCRAIHQSSPNAVAEKLGVTGKVLVHAWSPAALAWAVPGPYDKPRLVADFDFPASAGQLARQFKAGLSDIPFVVPSARAGRRLIEAGAAVSQVLVVREGVDFDALAAGSRERARARLRLAQSDRAVLILPPVHREAGGLLSAWASLLVERVLPGLRLLLPETGREAARIRHLAEGCQRAANVVSGENMPLSMLLVAADAAMYLPTHDAPVSALARAMAAATPIVASATPALTELIVDGNNGRLCGLGDVAAAARRLLQTLEEPEATRRQVEVARGQAAALFDRRRMIEHYQRAYENVRAGRAIGNATKASDVPQYQR